MGVFKPELGPKESDADIDVLVDYVKSIQKK